MVKKLIQALTGLLVAGVVSSSSIVTEADTEPELQLIRTTVYYAKPGAKTATGKTARVGHVAYKRDYFGKTCILYTQDMEYIGIYECEDTGGKMISSGQRLDVYTGTTLQSCYDWVAENGEYCYVQWIDAEG